MSTRGARFAAQPFVGNALYYTVGDRDDARAAINHGFMELWRDVLGAAGARVPEPFNLDTLSAEAHRLADAPQMKWWSSVGQPVFNQWSTFNDREESWWARFKTSYSNFKEWLQRLEDLRTDARRHGIAITSPLPRIPDSPLEDTITDVAHLPQDTIDATKHVAADAWEFVKVAAYGALGVGAVVLLAEAYRGRRK